MNKHLARSLALMLLFVAVFLSAQPRKSALLIGVGHYPSGTGWAELIVEAHKVLSDEDNAASS